MSFLEKKERKFGDRKDGILVRNIPSINTIMASIYPNRNDNVVSLRYDIDVTNLLKYIDDKNKENNEVNLKFFHCFIAAIIKVMNERRLLNRFVQGGRIYERDEISVFFVAKKEFSDDAGEFHLKYKAQSEHNVFDISKFVVNELQRRRKNESSNVGSNTENILDTFAKLPRILILILSKIIRILDFWGLVPSSIADYDPSYSSVLIANLGSIGSKSVIHHLNNYGTTSIMYCIGEITKKNIINDDGSIETRDVVDITANVDERIADGFYLANSQKLLVYILENPELLEKKFCEEISS